MNGFEQTVEGAQRAIGALGVAEPHRCADTLGDGLTEQLGLGGLQLGSRQVVHIDVGAVGDQLVDHREVVGSRVCDFGLDLAHIDRLLVAVGGLRAVPACAIGLQDVATATPEVEGSGYGHIVHHLDAQIEGVGTGQHRTEKDGFELTTRIGLGVFDQFTHNGFCGFWLVNKMDKNGCVDC